VITFWEKFRHRNVAKVATAYAVVGWLTLQLTEIVLPTFNAPLWIAQTIIFVVIMGFPIALLIAWAAESNHSNSLKSETPNLESESSSTKMKLSRAFWGTAVAGLSLVALFAFYVSAVLFDFSATPIDRTTAVANTNSGVDSLRFRLDLGETGSRNNGEPTAIDFSSDGTSIVYVKYVANGIQINLRDLTSFEEDRSLITFNTRSGGYPKFSKDDQWVFYYQANAIKRIRIEGGIPQNVVTGANVSGFDTTETSIYYTKLEDYGLYRRDLNSNEEELLLPGDAESFHTQAILTPENDFLITTVGLSNRYDTTSIDILNLETGEQKTIVPVGHSGRYISSGHLVFSRAGFLYAQLIDLESMTLIANPVPVILDAYHSPNNGYSAYAIAEDGTLVYIDASQSRSSFGGQRGSGTPVWISRDGSSEKISETLEVHGHPALSPEQNQVIFNTIDSSGISDLWVYSFDSNTLGRRSFGGGHTIGRWSPDGKRIFFNDRTAIYSMASNGTDSPTVEISTGGARPLSFDPTGNRFMFYSAATQGLWLSSRDADAEVAVVPLELVPDGSIAKEGSISPDGNLLVYTSNETGRDEIYVRPFPNITNGKWQISRNGGNQALWNDNGDELFFWSLIDNGKYAASFEFSNGGITFSEPSLMFQNGFRWDPSGSWDYSSSRDSFIGISLSQSHEEILANQTKLSVVQNWLSEVQRLVSLQ
tara:strand:- start:211 stop:2331 length:2121 start_codon:yes stop_codon:yes gene_type:complete